MDPRTLYVAKLASILDARFHLPMGFALADLVFEMTEGHAHLVTPRQISAVDELRLLTLDGTVEAAMAQLDEEAHGRGEVDVEDVLGHHEDLGRHFKVVHEAPHEEERRVRRRH